MLAFCVRNPDQKRQGFPCPLLSDLGLAPDVTQGHGAVEHQALGAGELVVGAEVTFTLELVGKLRLGIFQGSLPPGPLR